MHSRFRFISLLAVTTCLASFPASAQDTGNQAAMERVDRLERDLMLMQRQLSRAGVQVPAAGGPEVGGPPDNPAQLEVRLSAMETELRGLRGKIEENEFQNRRLTENFEKLQRDTEFRFNEMANAHAPAATTDAPADATTEKTIKDKPAASKDVPKDGTAKLTGSDAKPQATTAGDGVMRTPSNDPDSFATPRDYYNYGFRLLNQTKYEEAATAFDGFTKKYPKDPLVGNAYYWQGETYYIRRDYVSAADNFRQGFEALPEGPKAADNLLKLAMSLDALGRDKEACVVLQQVTTKFKKSSSSITDKAGQEQKRIGCH